MFKQLFRSPLGAYSSKAQSYETVSFRANSLSDICQTWLKAIRPWSNHYLFIQAVLNINFKVELFQGEHLDMDLALNLSSPFITRSKSGDGGMDWQFKNEDLH